MPLYELILAILGVVLQAVLAWLLVKRELWALFRFFFVYTCFSLASTVATILLFSHTKVFYYAYWSFEAGYAALAFLCLHEVFYNVFRNFYGILWFRLMFPAIGISMLVVAGLRIFLAPPTDSLRITRTIIGLEITVGFLQVGLFALFILLVRLFRMRSRQYAFGIALGFGIIAAGNLPSFLLRSEFGTKFNNILHDTLPIVYIIAVMVWLLTFMKGQPPNPNKDGGPALDPEELITELRQYTRVAKGVLRR
ncbi:MAG TPA: hypothetical protein VG649_13235 [Candidatus Angelobacter sp.]|nr:hypothetical protein [Candidatus Angelobacter sp.]